MDSFGAGAGIALTYPARSHFQRTLSRERRGHAWDEVAAHQKKEKNEGTKAGKRKTGEGRKRPILKKLCAALLRSFRG